MRTLSLWAAGLLPALLLGCGSSPPPEPEFPDAFSSDTPASDAPPSAEPSGEPGAAGSKPAKDDSIPDDYQIVAGDCVQLGRQFAAVTRMDQAAKLSPKLKPEQRSQAEKNIDEVATKLGDKWAESCEKSLVGQTTDPRSLKCALESKSVKDFDVCLNGPEGSQPAAQKK